LRSARAAFILTFLLAVPAGRLRAQAPEYAVAPALPLGYTDFSIESRVERDFLAVPDARLAGQHLKALTSEPHMAATPGDRRSAEYVAQRFRAAGLETEIVPYRVLLNAPAVEHVEAWDADGRLLMTGPHEERLDGDPAPGDPRIPIPFHGSSGSGDVTAEAVYANYCRLEDFQQLEAMHVPVRGHIVLCRYGQNFRGVKVFLAEQRGAAGVLIYSDPADDGVNRGATWPNGPWRPETGVQRGSVQYLFRYPGDPETPGVASTPALPDSERIRNFTGPQGAQPAIVSIPLSAREARPILEALRGEAAPQSWQGGFSVRYRYGGGVRIHILSQQNYQRRTIWDVIGRVRGARFPDEWIVAGNHRDAWVYGAVDPSSGTAAMLETVHGIGVLLHRGWRPRRTIVFASWDAEEQGLIGSTEWVEQHAQTMERAVAYFNMDVAVSGAEFSASATPSLKEFVRSVTRAVESPENSTVYQQWRARHTNASANEDVHLGELGSGSDFTPFFEHSGVPSTDITSDGPYGVYHSVFDSYAWYVHNADPHFVYLQQMARVFGLEVLRMDGARALPYDWIAYAREIGSALQAAQQRARELGYTRLDFDPAVRASAHLLTAARAVRQLQIQPPPDPTHLNQALRAAETALLAPTGLPDRPWYRHLIFAPGETTGYSAVILPGVNESLEARNSALAAAQLALLAEALDSAARTLELAR
jgi:N-acetylated-alpha-linked acidic dipeptidase